MLRMTRWYRFTWERSFTTLLRHHGVSETTRCSLSRSTQTSAIGTSTSTGVQSYLEYCGNSWEYLNMSIITEDWLLGSTEVFLSFLPLSSFSSPLPVGQSAILPSLALEEIRSSHSGPDVYPWQLQLPTSVPMMVEGGYGWLLFFLTWMEG